MKNVFKVSLLAAAVVLTVGCNEKKDASVAPANFENSQEKAAYAIGTSFSQQFNTMLEKCVRKHIGAQLISLFGHIIIV